MILNIQKDGSEKIKYDFDGYFAYVRQALLSHYPNYSADSHWHDDLEFVCVLSGSMKYNVNGAIVDLEAGNGIIVNARQLHYGFSDAKEECDFICVLLHPMLLCTSQSIERDYVAPILSDNTLPYVFLDQNNEWQHDILSDIKTMYKFHSTISAPLHIQSAFYHIWMLLYENTNKMKREPQKKDPQLSILKDMITFIQKYFNERISLSEIAMAGNVSKSTCLVIFKKYLNYTPANFLISYRLNKASFLIAESNLSISEIALSVGFSSISYFTETFHRYFDCTPSQYRNKSINL